MGELLDFLVWLQRERKAGRVSVSSVRVVAMHAFEYYKSLGFAEKRIDVDPVNVPDIAEILLKKNLRIKTLEERLEGLKALWNNGFWSQDEAYDAVYQFKEWTANEMMKLIGFPTIDCQQSEGSSQ